MKRFVPFAIKKVDKVCDAQIIDDYLFMEGLRYLKNIERKEVYEIGLTVRDKVADRWILWILD